MLALHVPSAITFARERYYYYDQLNFRVGNT
jgi:hypothetical protein